MLREIFIKQTSRALAICYDNVNFISSIIEPDKVMMKETRDLAEKELFSHRTLIKIIQLPSFFSATQLFRVCLMHVIPFRHAAQFIHSVSDVLNPFSSSVVVFVVQHIVIIVTYYL